MDNDSSLPTNVGSNDQLGPVVDAATIACWTVNYELDRTPHDLHAFWQAGAPPGAALALRAAVHEIERMRVALANESRRVCGSETDCVLQPHCSHEQRCMRPDWDTKA